jgi:hypothetical protein
VKVISSRSNKITHAVLLCTVASALLSLSSPSKAASTTLTLTGTPPATATVGSNYSYQFTGKDSINSRIRFHIRNKPSWVLFDERTGLLYGKPTRADVGTYKNIWITLTDWYGYVDTPAFSITVANAAPSNTAPTLTGRAPTTVNAGTSYRFAPQAADANHDKLSFSIKNKPSWAQFDTSSGALSGIPTTANVGTYANIQISVSDGKASAALPAFAVTVNRPAVASNAALDWAPPTANTDGTVLSNLAGYVVHYGTSPDKLTNSIKISNPGMTSYVIDNLGSGTWYFSVSSYAASGVESAQSNVISTTIL